MSIKSIKILFTILLFPIYFSSCTDDEIEIDSREGTFTEQARAYFEENASDIQPVKVGANAQNSSRSMNFSSNLIIPDWGKIKYIENQHFSTVEIPLSGDVFTKSIYSKKQEDGKYKKYLHHISTKLIVQRVNTTGEFRYFIATIVGKNRKSSEELNFISPHSLTGLIIISDLEGKYLDAYQFDNGSKQRVILAHAAGYAPNDITPSTTTSRFNLMNTEDANIFLRSGESGGITEGWFCPTCGGKYCDGCEVSVINCRGCRQPINNCKCCNDCDQWPCVCPRCPICGSKFCSADHSGGQVTPNPPTEEAEPTSISVSLSTNNVTLGQTYRVSASISPAGFEYNYIELEIQDKNGTWCGISSQENPVTVTAIQPGKWNVRATVNYGNDRKKSSTTKQITIQYPTVDEIMNNSTVRTQMNKAWQETLAAATSTQCCEYGGCVILNTNESGSSYYSLDYVQGLFYRYDVEEINVDHITAEVTDANPLLGGRFRVAHFHTHPSFLKAHPTKLHTRPVGPSTNDDKTAPDLPGILYDYVGNPRSTTDATRIHTNKDTSGLTINITTYSEYPRRKI